MKRTPSEREARAELMHGAASHEPRMAKAEPGRTRGETCETGMCSRSVVGGVRLCQIVLVVFFLLMAIAAARGQTIQKDSPFKKKIDIVEHLGDKIPLGVPVVNADGDTLPLKTYFVDDRPVMLVFHYSDCPMLCGVVLDGVRKSINQLKFTPGDEYHIVAVSLDPTETPSRTRAMQKRYASQIEDPDKTDDAWQFFTAPESSVEALTDAIGFKYYYDEELKQYMHPAAIYVLGSDGLISRYLYGIEYDPRNLKLALMEAARGKIGNTVDRIILYCCQYDPDAGSYTVLASNVMRLGGVVTLILLSLLLGGLFIRDRARHHAAQVAARSENTPSESEE